MALQAIGQGLGLRARVHKRLRDLGLVCRGSSNGGVPFQTAVAVHEPALFGWI